MEADGQGPGEAAPRRKPGSPIDPSRLLRVLVARKWILLGVFIVSAAAAIAIAKTLISNSYTTSAMLRFEGIPDVEGGGASTDPTRQLGAMVQSLFTEQPLDEISRRMEMQAVPRSVLRNLFEISFDNDRVVRIQASMKSGEDAARFVNTIVDVFLEQQLTQETTRLQDAAEAVRARITDVERQLEASRATYDQFRTEHGITDLTTEQEAAIEEAAQLRANRDRAASDVSALEARIERIRTDLRSTPRTSSSVVSTASREELQLGELRARLATERASLSADHPRVLALEEQVARLEAHVGDSSRPRTATSQTSTLYESLQTALSDASAELSATRQQLQNFERLASAAQERLSRFNTIEGDASRLLGEVRRKEGFLEELRAQHARLMDASRNPTHGFIIVSQASVPEFADPSKAKKAVAAGIPMLALVLALLVFFARELKGMVVMSPVEVAWWGNGPVIGASIWPRHAEALDDLVADLDDRVVKATGTMLVVALTPDASDLARSFSQRLGRDWYDTTIVGDTPFESNGGVAHGPAGLYPSLPPDTQQSHALALSQSGRAHPAVMSPTGEMPLQVEAWEGTDYGPALRRAARLADRVCVLVVAGQTSAPKLRQMVAKLGRDDRIGFVVVNLSDAFRSAPDRVGPVDAFWR